jgi:diaminohydroxyphosphoribosylaminopyrimidine deaminase/5-amino-6-(5-phosphoribosylamino)uracil reductase
MVGAVVVQNGEIVGEGWHKGYVDGLSTPHAETVAFAQAGEKARGATLYVTLEPCSHTHKSDGTPRTPCAERCIQAGVHRVVCAMEDPDERVSGRGFTRLHEAGIEVVVGVEEKAARALNRPYIRQRTTGLPYITHKAAMTADGKLAAPSGHSQWITGETARKVVHHRRNTTDAIVVGIGTVLADNPQLTVRLRRGNVQNPIRVVLDSRLRLPVKAQLVRAGTVVLTTEQADSEKIVQLTQAQVEVVQLSADATGRVDVCEAARWLADRGLFSILLESGGELAAAFWEARLVNRILYFIAPKVIGGRNSVTPIDGRGLAQTMQDAVQLQRLVVRRFGEDIALEAEVQG